MKELSIEEKARAYDEALKWMCDLYPNLGIAAKEKAESIFPELRGSENERIRGAIIDHLKDNNLTEWATWLEKQGQEPRKVSIWKHWKDGICGNGEGKLIYLIKNGDDYSLSSSLGYECDYILLSDLDNLMLEKQGEQKFPIEKFREGEWVVFNDKHESVYQIEKIENFQYILRHILGGSMPLSFSGEDMIRPWAIQDAKDGDVLACNEEILLFKSYSVQGRISLYCWYNGQTNNFHSKEVVDTLMTTRNKIYPATKEQRDILFSKMKEAGYEWDENNKILKEIVEDEEEPQNYKNQVMSEITDLVKHYIKQKPACSEASEDIKEALRTEYEKGRADAIAQMQKEWSEEDEKCIRLSTDIIDSALRAGFCVQLDRDRCIDWFNSLKERYIWKPSYKQIAFLKIAADGCADQTVSQILSTLYRDLKKLKGE